MNDLYKAVASLVAHGLQHGLLEECDRTYTINRILERLKLDSWEEPDCGLTADRRGSVRGDGTPADGRESVAGDGPSADSRGVTTETLLPLEEALRVILDYASEKGLLGGDSVTYRDLFDTEIMNCLLPRPSEVIRRFRELCDISPEAATDYFYGLSCASDYIRTYRVARDIKWTSKTAYGDMVITINLSKPEKDPRAIAAALTAGQHSYPRCQLCRENEGYAGRIDHPARANHRIIPISVNGQPWFLQYSPYVYFNEHCIVFSSQHTPMKIDHEAFDKLLDFERQFPHYCVGSNADLPIVGGSILTHDHFQGGRYEFPMAKAGIISRVKIRGFEDISAGIVDWPMTVIRLDGTDRKRLADCADRILNSWRNYTDEASNILAYTVGNTAEKPLAKIRPADRSEDATPHNTITPIARVRKRDDSDPVYELDLVLRNNLTTAEHPLGLYHPYAEHHHIKKENIGLIEVMGLAILPARLKDELTLVSGALMSGADIEGDERIGKHADWLKQIRRKYADRLPFDGETADSVIRDEVALVYSQILEQCAVFDSSDEGRAGLMRFVDSV